jgi:hypothetical protein
MASVALRESRSEVRFSIQECEECLENPTYQDDYPICHIRVKFESIQGQIQENIILQGKVCFTKKVCHCQTRFDSLSDRLGNYVGRLLADLKGDIQTASKLLTDFPSGSKDSREKLTFEPFLSYTFDPSRP